MSKPAPVSVALRAVQAADLEIFFAHERDPAAAEMAAFRSRDREAFNVHWVQLLADESVVARTILVDGRIAGNVRSFLYAGQREIGYWLGREFWGRGVATSALAAFLREESRRPLYGYVARHNSGSRRVLEKCGFKVIGEDQAFTYIDGVPIEAYVMQLDAGPD